MASDNKTIISTKTEQGANSQDIFLDANKVMDTALDIVKNGGNSTPNSKSANDSNTSVFSSVADSFRGLPMRDLIGGPLLAAAEAQQNLAAIAWDFYQKIAFEGKEGAKKTRILEFIVNRPVEQSGKMEILPQTIQAPFIGMVPIPSLLIDRIDIDFQMEVTDTNVDKSSTSAEVSSKVSGGWWVTKAEVSGKVSTSRENTRTTNQSAKYQVHVTAIQQPQTEGLAKLMDIMASCIEPMPVAAPKP